MSLQEFADDFLGASVGVQVCGVKEIHSEVDSPFYYWFCFSSSTIHSSELPNDIVPRQIRETCSPVDPRRVYCIGHQVECLLSNVRLSVRQLTLYRRLL